MIYLNGYDYETQGELDYFISPPIDLEATPNAQLKFDLAFAPYTSEDYQESLLVAVSKDCGNTFELLEAPYHKTGQSLLTVDAMSDQFIPNSGQQFRTELVNLAQYAGEGDIRIAFVSVNGFGNNIFVKDIEILATEEYRYDLEINRVINPGPVTDGSQAAEILEIANTGNLPISDFVIRRESSESRSQTYTVEDATLHPGETETFTFQANLNEA